MKKTMILGFCLALIASIIMIGGKVKAAEATPSVAPQTKVTLPVDVSVDKTTVKKGEKVTLTVAFPKEEVPVSLYSITFDNEKFSYISSSIKLIGYIDNEFDVDCQAFTSSDNDKDNPYKQFGKNIADDEIIALIELNDLTKTNISGFSVEFEVKQDLTRATSFVVSKVEMAENLPKEYTLDISVNPAETEPEQPGDNPADQPNNPQENPSDEPTNQPNNSQNNSTNKPADENTAELDETPKTGVVDYVGIAVAISMLSMLGVGILKRKK